MKQIGHGFRRLGGDMLFRVPSESSKGLLVLSLDTELGWGHILDGRWKHMENSGVFDMAREKIEAFVLRLDELGIPATWAFVGGMLEDIGDQSLPDLNKYPFVSQIAEALSTARETTFEGKDVYHLVSTAKAGHEIGWHTYLHVPFHHPILDEAYIRFDLKQALRLAKTLGRPFTSLVFPQNREGYHQLLPDFGFSGCRGYNWPADAHRWLARAKTGINFFLAPPSASDISVIHPGLVRMTGCLGFSPLRLRTRLRPLYRNRALRGIRRAGKLRHTFHLFTHPYTFGLSAPLFRSFMHIIDVAADLRDKQQIEILTMSSLVERVMMDAAY